MAPFPTDSGGAAVRPDLLELAHSGRVGAKSVSGEDDYLAVREVLQRAESGNEAVRPVSRVHGLFPLSTDLTNEYLKQNDRRLPAHEEYLWMSCFGAHMAALFVALDELLPYVPAANQDIAPYLARARNHAEAIDKAFPFRLTFLRRLDEVKRVHGDQGVLDVLQAHHFQPASEHIGSAIFGDLMKDHERRVFEATVASIAKATATARVAAAAAWWGVVAGAGVAAKRTLDLLSSSLTAQTLISYAGTLSLFAEFCHDSENISPLEATTATVVRSWTSHSLRKGAASAANAIGLPLSHIRFQGGWATNSDIVLDYIDPNVLPSPGAWFFFGHIAPHCEIQM
eukprot:jgi/Tetstr1/441308/TSEL_029559.t1